MPEFEVYGIPEEVGRCYGCRRVKGLLDDLSINYKFHKVMNKSLEGIEYNRPLIVSLASRLGQTSLNISYPVIFYDGIRIKNFNELKEKLLSMGSDPIIIEDYS